ncbi:uncharacterized protein LOC133832253 [Humulus lupulus]|uniref:uncharacterized protein LOC133832253 n=1 Tax=Humulus lupulus TaxID=3486 RepID=UPI002B40E1DB|nr:uncharacterized protein LOC133832253 [Humulus lupulus]
MDTSASHSFIADSFVEKIDRILEPMSNVCGVSLPSGEDLLIRSWARVVPVWVVCRELTVDLLVLDLHECDIIFGMYWLTKYGVIVNWKQRRVVFNSAGEEPFQGTTKEKKYAMISTMKARKMLDDGCIGYLASIVDKDKETELQLANIPIVCKFPEVFPEDLLGIPPDREVVFEIEFIPKTTPISKALYQMAPAELEKLQTQLQELLDKKFIRPSHTPWGALVLFVKKKDGSM